jgi:hypothetical protein
VTATILVSVYKIAFIFYILIFHFNKWIRIRIRINQLHERHPPDDFACISRFMLNRLVAFMGAAAAVATAATVALSAGCDAGGTNARRLIVNANA